jgi:O-antigen ligase
MLTVGILWMAVLHFVMADPAWGLLNLRDLAMFGYVLFFPVALFAIKTPERAQGLLELFNFSGALLGVILIVDNLLGGITGLFGQSYRITASGIGVAGYGGGDVGGMLAFSVAGFGAYLVTTPRRRVANAAGFVICLGALALAQTRSAFVGLALAAAYTALTFRRSSRDLAVIFGSLTLGLLLFVCPPVSGSLPIASAFEGLRQVLLSALDVQADGNAWFRVVRWETTLDVWRDSPVWGVGFGQPIVEDFLVMGSEVGGINSGMPHNSYLMILARTGLIGLTLFAGVHFYLMVQLDRRIRLSRRQGQRILPAELAAMNIMAATFGFANFVLFFERPMHNATYWIILAAACMLVGGRRAGAAREGSASVCAPATHWPPGGLGETHTGRLMRAGSCHCTRGLEGDDLGAPRAAGAARDAVSSPRVTDRRS